MLVSIKFKSKEEILDDFKTTTTFDEKVNAEFIDYINQCYPFYKEIRKGIYITDLNFNHTIKNNSHYEVNDRYDWYLKPFKENQNDLEAYFKATKKFGKGAHTYGVCDNYRQILRTHRRLLRYFKDTPMIISMTPIRKDKEPASGGWRWHKWGPYIGRQKPTCEYIRDEKKIEQVFCYQIYPVKLQDIQE